MKPPLLYLVHRIPFPPNKGDKLRSFNLLKFLALHYEVHLGCFVDYAEDMQHVSALDEFCASVHVEQIQPALAKLLSMRGLLTGEALTLPYYRSARMATWVREVVAQRKIREAVVFCSSMAQYTQSLRDLHCVVDFVDVDSAKWTRYAEERSGPMAWLYRREGARLADFERAVARQCAASVLVSEAEAALFREVAPASKARIHAISNGVNAGHYTPSDALVSPYEAGDLPVVFTGAMDYWPNIDAVCAFAEEVWPVIAARWPQARFCVVGMNPSDAVKALAARERITVTGTVPDVRPWLQHARVVVAPLRIARGVQNKILEAMAMARPVVASATCAVGVGAAAGSEFLVADSTQDWLDAVGGLLGDAGAAEVMGQRARARILADFSWEAHLKGFLTLLAKRDADTGVTV